MSLPVLPSDPPASHRIFLQAVLLRDSKSDIEVQTLLLTHISAKIKAKVGSLIVGFVANKRTFLTVNNCLTEKALLIILCESELSVL